MIDIQAIRERAEKATNGRWFWDVHKSGKYVCLESTGSRYIVMDFVRYGMSGAAPRFRDEDCIMRRADELAKSYPGKEHHIGFDDFIDHPDAELIAHAPSDIKALLAYIAEIEQERDAAVEDIRRLIASSPAVKCVLVCDGECNDCATSATDTPRGFKWRGPVAGEGEKG